MLRDRWFLIGLCAAVIGGLCCFTLVAVSGLTALGFAAYVGWIDVVAIPLFVIGVGVLVVSIIRLRQSKA